MRLTLAQTDKFGLDCRKLNKFVSSHCAMTFFYGNKSIDQKFLMSQRFGFFFLNVYKFVVVFLLAEFSLDDIILSVQ